MRVVELKRGADGERAGDGGELLGTTRALPSGPEKALPPGRPADQFLTSIDGTRSRGPNIVARTEGRTDTEGQHVDEGIFRRLYLQMVEAIKSRIGNTHELKLPEKEDIEAYGSMAFPLDSNESTRRKSGVAGDVQSTGRVVPTLRLCSGKLLSNLKELDRIGLPLGFVWTPFEPVDGIPQILRPPIRCSNCSAFLAGANGGRDVLNGRERWRCALCDFRMNSAGEAVFRVKESPQLYPELALDVVDYMHNPQVMFSEVEKERTPLPPGIVLLVDENLGTEQALWVKRAASALVYSGELRNRYFALITFSGTASATVFNSACLVPSYDILVADSIRTLEVQEKKKYFLELVEEIKSDCPLLDSILETAICGKCDLFETSRKKPELEENPQNGEPENFPDSKRYWKQHGSSQEVKHRVLNVALKAAIDICKGVVDSSRTRIISIVSGAPTPAGFSESIASSPAVSNMPSERLVKSTQEYIYRAIGNEAGASKMALDFLAYGCFDGFDSSTLMLVAGLSYGGVVLPSPHGYTSAESLSRALLSLATRPSSKATLVSLRSSSDIAISRVIGPLLPTPTADLYLTPGDDPFVGFTALLRPYVHTGRDTAVVQLASKNVFRTRVVTVALPMCEDVGAFMASLDREASALVLAKMCLVVQNGVLKEDACQKALDAAVRRILEGLNNRLVAGGRGTEYSLSVPVNVSRLLFEARRGVMLGHQILRDDACALRAFFLRADAEISSLMLAPRAFRSTGEVVGADVGMEEIAADTSSLEDSKSVVIVDAGISVFVWTGSKSDGVEAVEVYVQNVTRSRNWCQWWLVNEGGPRERLLRMYLARTDKKQGLPDGLWSRLSQPRNNLTNVSRISFRQYCQLVCPNLSFDLVS